MSLQHVEIASVIVEPLDAQYALDTCELSSLVPQSEQREQFRAEIVLSERVHVSFYVVASSIQKTPLHHIQNS